MPTKFCPMCGEERPVSEFYVITRGGKRLLSPYCMVHLKLKAKEAHQRRKWLKMMTPDEKVRVTSTVCASCGKKASNQPVVLPPASQTIAGWRLCVDCREAVVSFNWSQSEALTHWLRMRGHLKAVKEFQESWRANKPPSRNWQGMLHELVPNSPPWPHKMCEEKELVWRQVVAFLKTVQG